MSLEGIRDFSVIATAPQKRLAIKTFVAPWSEGLIREAVMRELRRGGQVYFLHNEVDSIERMKEQLGELLPEARIAVAHGQMRERELERVMRDFTAQRSVLLCSTIIETGIDNPHANTIVINRADKFGLAQLTSCAAASGLHHQAYAYLLTARGGALQERRQAAGGDPDDGRARLGLPRRCTTSRSAARARSSASRSRARSRKSASRSTRACSSAR